MILEVAASDRILVLSVDLQHVTRSTSILLVRISGLHARINNFIQHVNSNKVGHFGIHYLPVEQLKSKVELLRTAIALIGLHLHVIEVDFALAHARSHLLTMLLGRWL